MSSISTEAFVENEGATLCYWYQGTGPLLILVPGGGGHGFGFTPSLPYLSKKYKVVAYSRRYNGKSIVAGSLQHLNPAQQARDIIAIAKALGYEKFNVYGNSGGGIISLQLAVSYPQYIEHMIVHEAPTISLLPDSAMRLDRCYDVYRTFHEKGANAAMDLFTEEFLGYEGFSKRPRNEVNMALFFGYEFLAFTIYCPDLRRIKDAGVSIAVAAGERSKDTFFARTPLYQAEIIDCPRVMLAGNHSAFDFEPEAFSRDVLKTFEMLEDKKRGKSQ